MVRSSVILNQCLSRHGLVRPSKRGTFDSGKVQCVLVCSHFCTLPERPEVIMIVGFKHPLGLYDVCVLLGDALVLSRWI